MLNFLKHIFYVKPKPVINTISKLRMMRKKELELLGRKHGIELDRRYKKETLVKELWDKMSNV
tara:strand:+ start:463 stop:651 length:189 start_codon:yes stop_codon:yes gene_type:complete